MSDDSFTDRANAGASEGQHDIGEEGDRSMGFATATAIGVGTMIAAGIFVLSGLAVSKVGTAAIVSFLIAAVVASLTAASYAEFSSIYPESGGGYLYVSNTIPSDLTYIMGWTMILGYPASAAFYLASFADWFYRFLYQPLRIPEAVPYWVSGLLILGFLVGLNLMGTEETGTFQIVVTSLKVLLIIFFLYGAFQAFDSSVVTNSFSQNVTEFANLGVTSALVFITFFGFSAIATDAEEIEDPGNTIPKSIYVSMVFVTVIYAFVVIAIVLAVNNQAFLEFLRGQVTLGQLAPAEFVAEHGELAMGLAARFYLGQIGFYVIIAGALLSMLSAANATILAGSRVKLALARNEHLPPTFEEIHDDWGTPYKTVLLTGGFILAYIGLFTVVFRDVPGAVGASIPFGLHLGLEALANFANFLLIIGLSVVNLALIRSRQRFPEVDRGFRVPLVPWVPAIAILGNLILLANIVYRHPAVAAIGILAELVGVGVWYTWQVTEPPTERLEAETPTAVVEHHHPEHDYQLVVPIANENNVEQLMRTATDLVRDRDAELLVMNALQVPRQTPYSEARQAADRRRPIVDRALTIADEAGVPATGTIRIAHDPADAILNTIEQYDSEGVLMGWGGHRSARQNFVLGSNVDKIATEADADVFVEKVGDTGAEGDVESILLPWTDSTHANLAAETARTIGAATDARIDMVRVVESDTDAERERAAELLEDATTRLEDAGITVETRVIESDDIVETLVEEADEHDVTVMGAESEGILRKLVFGTVPEAVGDRTRSTSIMTQRHVSPSSYLKQLFT